MTRNKIVRTMAGVVVLGVDMYLLVSGATHNDYFFLVLAGIGGYLISSEIVEGMIGMAAKLIPWKSGASAEGGEE